MAIRVDSKGARLRAAVLRYVLPFAVLVSLWLPDFAYYYVSNVAIVPEAVERNRIEPAAATLAELERMELAVGRRLERREDLVAMADAMLAGELSLPAQGSRRFDPAFDAADLTVRVAALPFASLYVPNVWLDAYLATGRETYFLAAKEFLLGFAAFERSAWRPKGMIWNDHAIAARIPVVIKFWRTYRERGDFDAAEAAGILQLLARSGQFLAKPSHYTYRTNHGVMQNVGLLQLCVAFPALPQSASWCDTALGRLGAQMRYYVNDEGVVLEHSAGYHAFGLELFGMVLRIATLAGRAVPPEWSAKYERAKGYYASLRRPDGTLPMYGDTPSTASNPLTTSMNSEGRFDMLAREIGWRPRADLQVYPGAGHALWWRGLEGWPEVAALSQVAVTWSNFPSRAHKLADEMSVVFWHKGHSWITNSGYWPYGAWGRAHAEGWEGSNAPHLEGEAADSSRRTELLGYLDAADATLVDLRRHGEDGYVARRQLMQLPGNSLLVLDHVQDRAARRSSVVWTIDPALRVERLEADGGYRLVAPDGGGAMLLTLLNSTGATPRTYMGSRDPFAGWVVVAGVPRAAPAIAVTQPSTDSWALALWSPLGESTSSPRRGTLAMQEWRDAEHWSVRFAGPDESATISRAGPELVLTDATGRARNRWRIAEAPDASADRRTVEAAFHQAQAESAKFRELWWYRLTLTYWLLGALVAQEAVFFMLGRATGTLRRVVRWGAAAAWILVAVVMHGVLLV